MSALDTENFRSVMLQRVKYHVAHRVDGDLLRFANVQANAVIADYADVMLMRLTAEIAGKTTVLWDESFPATWWDAVKDRWFPSWARKRWPVNYRHIKVDQHTLFPTVEIPGHDAKVHIEYIDRTAPRYFGEDDD